MDYKFWSFMSFILAILVVFHTAMAISISTGKNDTILTALIIGTGLTVGLLVMSGVCYVAGEVVKSLKKGGV